MSGLAGLGVAIATKLSGVGGLLKSVGKLAAKIPWYVYLGLAIAAAFLWTVHDRNKWKTKAVDYNAEAVGDYQAAKTASANPDLARRDTAKQIVALGQSLKAVTDALNRQNAAVKALGDETARQQAEAKKAVGAATARASEAEVISARLKAESHSGAGKAASACEPSDLVKEQWQ